jgi:lipopolysaccharide export system protein LptC
MLEISERHGFDGGAQRENGRAFQRAMRHSRRVRALRWMIPGVMVLVVGIGMLAMWLDPVRMLARLPVSAEGLVISGTKITMAAPKLSGYTSDARRYELTAQSAAQDITKPDLIELKSIDAKLDAGKLSTVHITAQDGVYERSKGLLTLKRDVKLKSMRGTELRLEEALVNTGTGEVVSDKPVEVRTPQGTVRADRLEVDNSGDVVRFVGGVIMKLSGDREATNNPPTGKP